MPISASQIAAAAARLEELDKLERFDGAVPGSRPNAFQQAIIDDWGKYPTQAVTAGNQCLPGDTLVMTPKGPVPLALIQVGDIVYDENGEEQVVVKTWQNGQKEIADLTTRGRTIASCTASHKWWTNTYSREDGALLKTRKVEAAKLGSEDAVCRAWVKAPLGEVHEPHAYAIGALLGDGCSRQSARSIQISSGSSLVPEKVAQILGGVLRKLHISNHTWCVGTAECHLYSEWCKGKYAHEKVADLNIIQTWDRDSLLAFVAGLLDTDGTVYTSKDHTSLMLSMQARSVVDAFVYAAQALWQIQLSTTVDARGKYKNGPVYVAYTRNIHEIKRILDELGPHLVTPSKKWRPELIIGGRRSRPEAIKLTWGKNKRMTETYDLTVSGKNNVYLLANGLVTSNSGKSSLGARLAAWFLAENKPGWVRPASWGTAPLMGLIIGRTMSQVENELLRKIQAFFEEDELRVVRVGNAAQSVIHKGTGNKLLLASHHNEREAREKVQSFVLNFEWLDEMPRSVKLFEELERRVQSRDGWFISTFTPKVKSIDIRKLIESYAPPFSKSYKMPMFANPILSEERKEKILQELEAYPEEYRRCILEGDWLTDDQAVYQIDPDRMVKKAPGYHYGWRHVESADPATNSKHGQVVFAEDPNTRFWYIKKADYITGIRIPSELIKTAANKVSHLNVVRRVCDPASTWYIYEASGMGFTYMTPWGKTNGTRREEMMKNLQERLGVDLFIDPECEDLIEELSSMEWSETQAAKVVNSRSYHLHDATIYGLDCLPPPEKTPVVMDYWARIHAAKEAQIKAKEAANRRRINRMKYRW